MDIKNLLIAGGVVMWPLLGSSIVGVGLIAERIKFWLKVTTSQERVVREVLKLYRQDNVVSKIDTLATGLIVAIPTLFFANRRKKNHKNKRVYSMTTDSFIFNGQTTPPVGG
jgi:biopolymer transport protein ExbB